MAEEKKLVLEKLLGLRVKEVLGIIQDTAVRYGWGITYQEQVEKNTTLTVSLRTHPQEFRFELSEEMPRVLTSAMKTPRTCLTVWGQGVQ